MGERLTRIDLSYIDMLAFKPEVFGDYVFTSVRGRKQDETGKGVFTLFDGDKTFEVYEDKLLESAVTLTNNELLLYINEIFRFFAQLKKNTAGVE